MVEHFEVEHQSVLNLKNEVFLKKAAISCKYVVKNEYPKPANRYINRGFNNNVFRALRFNVSVETVCLLLKYRTIQI